MSKSTLKGMIKNAFKGESDSFILSTALKIVLIAILILVFIYFMLYSHMKMNSYFILSMGYPSAETLETFYYDYLTKNLYVTLPYVFAFFVFLFLAGIYIAKSLLRPFDVLAEYSELAMENHEAVYENNYFSSQKLLANFGEYFFNYARICKTDARLRKNLLPPQYTKIHAPVFDKVFFFHFSLILGIICILSSWFIYVIAVDIQANIVELALKILKSKGVAISTFLTAQNEVFEGYILVAICITFIFYIILGFHLYSKVSGAAFGFFATMRSFMKGNFFARIHLIGFNHIRPQSRKVNQFLDYLQKSLPVEE